MATLYVVGTPAGDPDDLTLRARRILAEASCVVAGDIAHARHLLERHELSTQIASLDNLDALMGMLESGDLALLAEGGQSLPSSPALALIRLALEGHSPVVPVPGPSLPITALVISGLPADSFVYLGELPRQPVARHTLLSSLRHERRTLVVLGTTGHMADELTGLLDVLGERTLVLAAASEGGTEVLWRGTIHGALEQPPPGPMEYPLVLVIGGASDQAGRWDEEQLQGEVRARLGNGLGAKEVSQQLAGESGWPRREVYRLAVEAGRFRRNE